MNCELFGRVWWWVLVVVLLVGCVGAEIESVPTVDVSRPLGYEVVVEGTEGLVVALAFGGDGRLFFATREGGVYTYSISMMGMGEGDVQQLLQLEVARKGFEDGLLGLALAPDFGESGRFFIYYIVPNEAGEPDHGRVVRYRFDAEQMAAVEETVILPDLPVMDDPNPEIGYQLHHFGGGLRVGPDGKLYFVIGDTNNLALAQEREPLPGSVLRYELDGSVPADNPWPESPVYAYGFRNGFALAWHPETGALYEVDNGSDCDDELNLVRPGGNYGWGVHEWNACPYPDDVGEAPLYEWTPPIAPAGLLFYTGGVIPEWQGKLLVCAHSLNEIRVLTLDGVGERVLEEEAAVVDGRSTFCQADVAQGPDGWVYTASEGKIWRIGR